MTSMTQLNAVKARDANDIARETRIAREKGTADRVTMNQAIGAIRAARDDVAKIVKTIDEIVFTLNLGRSRLLSLSVR